jgi:membrane protein insertase Oxa1/YidC/SpoIIIJ
MSQSFFTIKITVFHSENGGDWGQIWVNFTVLAPFWHVSATVIYVYNVVNTLHTVSSQLSNVWISVILCVYTLKLIVVDDNSTVGSVYINRKRQDRYSDLEQRPDA